MTAASFNETVGLGVITGMRSMAGPAALALRHQGLFRRLVPLLALGEMVADKTPGIGDRIDPIPLAGRALMGALVGGVIARERGGNMVLHALVGASAAVVAAHLAYRARKALPLPGLAGGLLEDSIVTGIASFYARR